MLNNNIKILMIKNYINSITFKLLSIVIANLAIMTIIILIIANTQLTRIIDKSQEAVYNEKIEIILETLRRSNERLIMTGSIDVYIDDFKKSALNTLKKTYYGIDNQFIYPFIIDINGNVVMDVPHKAGESFTLTNEGVQKFVSTQNGNFESSSDDFKRWYIYRYFSEWDWIIFYTIPLDVKYADSIVLSKLLFIIIVSMTTIMLIVLSFFLTKITKPIVKLTNISHKIADGDLDQIIDLQRNDEIGILSQSFENMRGKIKNQIFVLNKQINERKQAEDLLRKSEVKYRSLYESSKDAILILDPEMGYLDCNQASLEMFGFSSKQEFLNLTPIDLSPEYQQDGSLSSKKAKEMIDKVIIQGSYYFNFLHKRINGEVFPASVLATRMDLGGKVLLQGTIRDLTEQQRISEENTKLEEQLAQSRKMDAIGQLAGGVAHDFNNMLGGIMNSAQLLKSPKRKLDERGIKYVDLILQASERAADLTAKLLAFGHKGKLMSTAIDVHNVIEDVLSILIRTLDKKINISFIKKAKIHTIIGDNSTLQNAIINLCINSSHSMPSGGDISVKTTNITLNQAYCDSNVFDIEPGKYIEIEVRDNGSGIPQEYLQRIFEPFFTTKDLGQGTGLGLASVYGTIQDHHGAINLYSKVGTGTVFKILLPCSEATVKNSRSSDEVISGKGLILLVDDEEINRISGKHLLEEMGYSVICADNGLNAIDIFKNRSDEIDFVIMDMIMPEMSGREAFIEFKKIDTDCKVIIASGFTKDENLYEMRELGLCGFISKPYSNIELSKLIAQNLKD